jgi:peptidoglycan/LPS O-acetylase OafA/YrhL
MRNRYIDTLRASAIIRVIVYHTLGWAWLTVALPAMGVMFALAGSLMATSLTSRGARRAVTSRIRRLVPALWALGLVAVPLMLLHGWSTTDAERPLSWSQLPFWIIPLGDPPGSNWGEPFWQVLWYLRAYLWFVLASPLLYFLYRRAPLPTIAAPLVALAVIEVTGFRLPGMQDDIMWDFVTYAACWMAGFAHSDGSLARIPLRVHLALVGTLAVGSLTWLLTHPGPAGILDINAVPIAGAPWSLAFVLAALRWRPTMAWLDRVRPIDTAIRLMNARAVTIYLWHYPMITAAGVLLAAVTLDDTGPWTNPLTLTTVLLLTAVMSAALGWVEDLAAHRRPALWPLSRRPRPALLIPTPEPATPVADATDPAPASRTTPS